jgi:hypothetical protein
MITFIVSALVVGFVCLVALYIVAFLVIGTLGMVALLRDVVENGV